MVTLMFRGRSQDAAAATVDELIHAARAAFDLPEDTGIRLVHKGKQLVVGDADVHALSGKVLIMATASAAAAEVNTARSDPTVRSFEAEDREEARRKADKTESRVSTVWRTSQDPQFKFTRIQVVSWQSFGHRPGSTTPHAFAARELLERLATDPGVVACMRARELVVGSLGEMDPIDDRLMKAKRGEGGDLLGYNTNMGMRIDIKLRTDDLSGFMPYPQLVETLLHELCHNWVGPHNHLFWTLFAQMRVEYLHEHMRLAAQGVLIGGQTTAALAGVHADCVGGTRLIAEAVIGGIAREVGPDMARAVEHAVHEHIAFMDSESQGTRRGVVLGSGGTLGSMDQLSGVQRLAVAAGGANGDSGSTAATGGAAGDVRARAAAAAEARAAAAAGSTDGRSGAESGGASSGHSQTRRGGT